MATPTTQQPPKMQRLPRGERGLLSESDDNAMIKQIQATHTPSGRVIDAKPVLLVVEEILRHAQPDQALNRQHGNEETLDDKFSMPALNDMLEALSYITQKIACEISCKCSGGADAHVTTMVVLNTLSSYSWDAKVAISLAAFAVNYGEFWLVTQLLATNPLARSVALIKQLPDIIDHANLLRLQFDTLSKLIKATLDVAKCIIEFTELPTQYVAADKPPMSLAIAYVPLAAYWCIRSILACASRIAGQEYSASAMETWEQTSLAHKIRNIHEYLKKQLIVCYQHIDEKKHQEAYYNLIRLFESLHIDNMKILRALIYAKDDRLPLVNGTTKAKVGIEVLRRKYVLLLISDLDISKEELEMLQHMYRLPREVGDAQYEMVWLPIVDRETQWNDDKNGRFLELQSMMSWYSVVHPSIIEPAVIRYIREVWRFMKKAILVPLDPQGKVLCQNAIHMLWIWGNDAFPFNIEREETLWKTQVWQIVLLVDGIDPEILGWFEQDKVICLYGGEDMEWIRKFTTATKAVAQAAGIGIEMFYVGKSNPKERIRKIAGIIEAENMSHTWPNLTSVWFFWVRLESMLLSKNKLGMTIDKDPIMSEILTLLSFDGSDNGWAIFCQKSTHLMARAKSDLALQSMFEFEKWKEEANEHGFIPALKNHLEKLHSPQHCNRLILPGIEGGIPERIMCAECHRPMEKFFMYRCCVD